MIDEEEYKVRFYYCVTALLELYKKQYRIDTVVFDTMTWDVIEKGDRLDFKELISLIKSRVKKAVDEDAERKQGYELVLRLNTKESPFRFFRDTEYEFYKVIDPIRLKVMFFRMFYFTLVQELAQYSDQRVQVNALDLQIKRVLKEYSKFELEAVYKKLIAKIGFTTKARIAKMESHFTRKTPDKVNHLDLGKKYQ